MMFRDMFPMPDYTGEDYESFDEQGELAEKITKFLYMTVAGGTTVDEVEDMKLKIFDMIEKTYKDKKQAPQIASKKD